MMDFPKKIFWFLLFFVFFVFCKTPAIAEPNLGDGVYRDMAIWWSKPTGHAGVSIGNSQVIHMQSSGCCLGSFSSSFSQEYWGAITQGDLSAAEKRVREAKDIYNNKHPKYHFFH